VIDIEAGVAGRVLESTTRFMPADEVAVIDGSLVGFKDADGNATPWHLSMNAISIDPTYVNA